MEPRKSSALVDSSIAATPDPRVPLSEIGVLRWQHDLWIRILQAAIDGKPNLVSLDWHASLSLPAAQRYSASSPHLLAWLDQYNAGRAYEDQIRPFGFLLVFTAKSGVLADSPDPESCIVDSSKRGRPPKCPELKPIAPFDSDPARALSKVFDRLTGKPVRLEQLKTYAEVLVQYHLSPEHKFANGDHLPIQTNPGPRSDGAAARCRNVPRCEQSVAIAALRQ